MSATHFNGPVVSENGFESEAAMTLGGPITYTVAAGVIGTYDADGAVSPLDDLVLLDGTDEELAMSLADGVIGKVISFKCIEATNNSVLTPDNLADGATLTFDAVGEVTILAFDGTEWQIIYNTATLA